jgi:hypothetical protein
MGIEGASSQFEINSKEFLEMERDPEKNKILQIAALEYLKTNENEPDFMERWGYTGEVDEDGYMIKKDGSSGPKPSQHFSGDVSGVMDIVRSK